MLTTILIYLVTGLVAGLMAGLFGVGGGMIMVPALALVLAAQGVAVGITMQVAIATSLAVISATSISSMHRHHQLNGVLWPVFRAMAPGLAVGALAGAFVADVLPSRTLAQIVGVGALLTALQMWLDLKPKAHTPLPGNGGLAAAGGVIGLLSSLIGIGGGSLTVPFLSGCSVPIRHAVGTAAACGVPIAWAGALGFMIAGLGEPGRTAWSVGYVDLAGFAGIALASVPAARLGATLAHRLSPRMLKRSFAVLLTLIGIQMLLG
ncbi:MAG: sulfite exporter TauE/SafE family protein [Nevskiales bacterium]